MRGHLLYAEGERGRLLHLDSVLLSCVYFHFKGKSKETIFKEQEERKEKKTCVGLCYLTKVSNHNIHALILIML